MQLSRRSFLEATAVAGLAATVNRLVPVGLVSSAHAAEAAKASYEKIAAIRKDAEAKRAVISERFEQRRAEYADKVFSLVIGAADE